MSNAIAKLSKPSVFLFTEFVIIVLGVLVALAVEDWRTSREDADTRDHLIASLLSDLREDRSDYDEFVADSRERVEAAEFIGELLALEEEWTQEQRDSAKVALHLVARTSRLETVDSTFREMSSLGSGATIGDNSLRLQISYYYGLARDRSDINELLMPAMLRYRAMLNELGFSYVDRENLDPDAILQHAEIRAVIRELGAWARSAAGLPSDLQEKNVELIARLEAELDPGGNQPSPE